MNLAEFLSAASDAWSLLAADPWRWLAVVLVFLVAVESLMFIPYVGFVVKLAVAGVVVAQVIAIFAAAASGRAPSPDALLSAFSLPLSSQLALAGAAVLPFAVGALFLYVKGGPSAVEFFFGNMFRTKPPSPELFVQFKYVMHAVALPFTLLAGAVAIKGLSGFAALTASLAAAAANWLPVLLLGLLALAFEWFSAQLPTFMPKGPAALIGGVLLIAFLAWTFALTYTVSSRVFAAPTMKSAT